MGGQTGSANMFLINLANGAGAGATVRFTIRANDGGRRIFRRQHDSPRTPVRRR